jgi:hypothetical protein
MRSNVEGARIRNNLMNKNRTVHAIQKTTATSLILTADIPDFLELQLGAACNVRLPASTPSLRGRQLTILNNSTAANTATMKTSTNGALSVASTIVRYRMKKYINNGTNWFQDSSN